MRLVLLAVLAVVVAGCDSSASVDSPPTRPETSAEAAAYLDEVLDLMEAHAVNRHRVDWATVRAEAAAAIRSTQTIGGTYPGIRIALAELDVNNHSFLILPPPLSGAISAGGIGCRGGLYGPVTLPDDIGYVQVLGFGFGLGAEADGFAGKIQRDIARQAGSGVVGWIVDLRGNTGGNMWPMYAGLGPLLGEGTIGHFIAPSYIGT